MLVRSGYREASCDCHLFEDRFAVKLFLSLTILYLRIGSIFMEDFSHFC